MSYGPTFELGPQPRVLERGLEPEGEVRRSPNYVDMEAIREKVLREAENLFAKEIKKVTGGAESSSFESVPSAGREPGRPSVGVMGPGGGGNGGESASR